MPDYNMHIVSSFPADDDAAAAIIAAPLTDDGRSEWRWFVTSDNDLILGCFPCGDTYFATELAREADWERYRQRTEHG